MEKEMRELNTKLCREGAFEKEGMLLALEHIIDDAFADLKKKELIKYWLGMNILGAELEQRIDEFEQLLRAKIESTHLLYRGESFDSKDKLIERLEGIENDRTVEKSADADYYPKGHEDLLAKRGDKTTYVELTASRGRAKYFSERREYGIIFFFDESRIKYDYLRYYGDCEKDLEGNAQFINEEEVRAKIVNADAIKAVSIYMPEPERDYGRHIVFIGSVKEALNYLEANRKIVRA
ncbi:MAG: hypothetical protein ACP5FN_02845 [Candidatus Micrarchaeia archaeon]